MEGDAVIAPFFMFYSIFLKISRQKFGGIFLFDIPLPQLNYMVVCQPRRATDLLNDT